MLNFQTALDEKGSRTTRFKRGSQVLSIISEAPFDLLVVDEILDDMSGLKLIELVIKKQPMLNCAAVSSLSSGDFHKASEGLGILMQLPAEPGRKAADQLLKHLNQIQSITTPLATPLALRET